MTRYTRLTSAATDQTGSRAVHATGGQGLSWKGVADPLADESTMWLGRESLLNVDDYEAGARPSGWMPRLLITFAVGASDEVTLEGNWSCWLVRSADRG